MKIVAPVSKTSNPQITSVTKSVSDIIEEVRAMLSAVRHAVDAGTGSATEDDDQQSAVALMNRVRAHAHLSCVERDLDLAIGMLVV